MIKFSQTQTERILALGAERRDIQDIVFQTEQERNSAFQKKEKELSALSKMCVSHNDHQKLL
jgi:hypothetical protein